MNLDAIEVLSFFLHLEELAKANQLDAEQKILYGGYKDIEKDSDRAGAVTAYREFVEKYVQSLRDLSSSQDIETANEARQTLISVGMGKYIGVPS